MRMTFPWRKMDWNSNAKRKSVFTSFQLSSIMPQQYTNSKVSYQLVAASWSKTKNCAYVVLSRVLSLDGLFLMDSWNPSWNPLICALWPGFLDLCTWTTGTVQSLKMVSLIGFHVICAHLCTWSTGIILVQCVQCLIPVWKWILWSVFLDLRTCLEMASLIGFPWSVHFDLISLIFALDLQELSKVWKWLLWSVFLDLCTLIYRNCPQFGNGFFDRFALICALDLQELSTVWKWLLWSVLM
jgi:hypothetical protein